uniref:Uncharacterized protein n=1 Tax=Rhizophora mucronata TaxID=61149 RepID=A0A2P2NWF9_RHIMU
MLKIWQSYFPFFYRLDQ